MNYLQSNNNRYRHHFCIFAKYRINMETTNVSKLIAVTKKYTRIDELTPEILNAFVDKIVIHEREKKDGKRTQQIDIYYSYVGIVDIPTDEEMREMEREYMQRTTRQTA